ncbi:alpha/beta hydrolase [Hoyosella rhizosphaerae]|uniref:Protease n=1 Tax=Hoyosella rhizosphaerae TaxID=1755582 RepID=A0A916UHU1_9ACTN|nr:alpha/beta hydrolase [Hoyosella rhizosphaerae]MBN4927987.1 alpha/beta hydrolase [Hoyosella rhizosphaerae]GGC71472.1 protease [Hoyosella rhizosphaerae]
MVPAGQSVVGRAASEHGRTEVKKRRHGQRGRLLTGACLGIGLVLAITACAQAPDSSFTPAEPQGFDPDLAEFYTQELQWESCDEYANDADTRQRLNRFGFTCAYLAVPLSYEDPTGDVANIAVTRTSASGNKIGSLVMNPGGPGAGGISAAANVAAALPGTQLGERFDFVSFDPRGIGASTPAIACLSGPDQDSYRQALRIDMSPEGIAETEADTRRYVEACERNTGLDVLSNVGTRDVARDLDVLRAALGDEQLTFLGYSYGTFLGAVYAEQFPDKVRAMVLDGAVDPAEDLVETLVRQGEGFQRAFDAFVDDCLEQPQCPLGSDVDNAVKEFRVIMESLIDDPAFTSDPRNLTYSDGMAGVYQALYSPQLWTLLRTGLTEVTDGLGDTLLFLADTYEGRRDDGTYRNTIPAFHAVSCVDSPPETDRARRGEADMRYREVAPFADGGQGTGEAPLDFCAFWPVLNTSEPRDLDIDDALAPTLVVSTTGDPATPYEAGLELARQLGGSLLTYEGNQHTVVLGVDECVDQHVERYLIDLQLPESDPRCG